MGAGRILILHTMFMLEIVSVLFDSLSSLGSAFAVSRNAASIVAARLTQGRLDAITAAAAAPVGVESDMVLYTGTASV